MTMFPYFLPDQQGFAVEQERYRHNQALYAFGEDSIFVLMWRRPDFDRGLVGACLNCVVPYGATGSVYGQPALSKCPECFGTGYEGGFRALIVRPALWDATEQDAGDERRGFMIMQNASVQSTSDFRLNNDDYIFRADGTRWQVRAMSTNHLRTGMTPAHDDEVGFNFGTVTREDESSVSYTIPPLPADTITLLSRRTAHSPVDYSQVEIIRAPLK